MTSFVVDNSFLLDLNPTDGSHAATKSYLETRLANINTDNFVGVSKFTASKMPSLGGKFTAAQGSTALSMVNSNVVPGAYTKVTVDATGVVTAGVASLSGTDIPATLSFNKITSNRPSSVTGYGITDAITNTDTAMTGLLTIGYGSFSTEHLVPKSYVDSIYSAAVIPSVHHTGDIIARDSTTSLTGYLRCNGAAVSKTTYATLFSAIGDAYSVNTNPGSGLPWLQQYDFNTTQSTDITGWASGTSLSSAVLSQQVIVTKNRVYILGGHNGISYLSNVYTAPINADGTLGTWVAGTAIPGDVKDAQVVVTKNRVYLLGGTVFGNSHTSTVYTAPINTDGTLGSWVTGTALAAIISLSSLIVTVNRVYLLGGSTDGGTTNNAYTCVINSDGTLGTWSTLTGFLPKTAHACLVISTKKRVYLLGGYSDTPGYYTSVHSAVVNADGTLGSWVAGTDIPVGLGYGDAIVTRNRVYLINFLTAGGASTAVYTAPINSDGTLGTWTTGTSVPASHYYGKCIVTGAKIYLIGGGSGTAIRVANFTGGKNDYSQYYDGSVTLTSFTDFKLPDLSSIEKVGLKFFIKT